ncbi:MAG: hypothetical protein IPO94_12770 [Saprospiraceae bacterium]|nr:hypothetical protein [Saprospiraceae bacterium]
MQYCHSLAHIAGFTLELDCAKMAFDVEVIPILGADGLVVFMTIIFPWVFSKLKMEGLA